MDQAFTEGRTVYAVMERLTAELFSTYVRRTGDAEPYFTEYCDGKLVTCKGMKQWGTVDRANEGKTALQILRYYYGNDVNLVTTNNIAAIPESYPGSPLRLGSTGTSVRIIQRQLDRIAKDYPAFGKPTVNGTFDATTQSSVKAFQKYFSLTADGVVGQATWDALYAAWVEVQSDMGGTAYPGTALRTGSKGNDVRLVQFWLRIAADNYSTLQTVTVDGNFGSGTAAAVKAFQSLFGLTADGIVGRATWFKLNEVGIAVANKLVEPGVEPGQFVTTLRQGSTGTPVRALQYYLRLIAEYWAGVPSVAVDGVFGAATTESVKAWQQQAGLTVDGIVGPATWQSIYENAMRMAASGPVVRLSPLPEPARTLVPGDVGTGVLVLSQMLAFLAQWLPAIPAPAETDVFDAAVELAVQAAQQLLNLPVTGQVGPEDWQTFADAAAALYTVTPSAAAPEPAGIWPGAALAAGSAGPAVLQVQQWLNVLGSVYCGYSFVEETGVLDAQTLAVLEAYQEKAGLDPVGVVDDATWLSLRAAAAPYAAQES